MNDESLIIQCNRMFYPDCGAFMSEHISELKGEQEWHLL